MTNGEKIINIINMTFFFKEFSFPRNLFIPGNESQLEFADLVIAIGKRLIIFQHKGRDKNSIKNHNSELRWFKNTVIKEAKDQIKKTISYLKKYEKIPIQNNHNYNVDLSLKNYNIIHKIIIYDTSYKFDDSILYRKFYKSRIVGLIHILSKEQYELICKTLQTPIEIFAFLNYREQIYCNSFNNPNINEKISLGFFLSKYYYLDNNDYSSLCDLHYSNFKKEEGLYDLKFLINNFHDRIIGKKHSYYYLIIQELALLNCKQIKQFNLRLISVKNKSKLIKKYTPNYISIPVSNCSFLFSAAPINSNLKDAILELTNDSSLLKYYTRVDKCIGLIVFREVDDFHYQIHWVYISGKWKYNKVQKNKIDVSKSFSNSIMIMRA